MEKIESFKVNHELLKRGIYVSRRDYDNKTGNVIATTFDIRMKEPNREPVINIAEIHTIEHLGATFLRNHPKYKNETIYFGPMGCRTGFYVIFKGELDSKDIVEIIKEMFSFIAEYEGEVPGADPVPMIPRIPASLNLDETLLNIKEENLVYPE